MIAPGWYAVAGTDDVRWWDGRSFRDVTLVDGEPRYRFSWGLPAGNYLLGGVVMLAIAVGSLVWGGASGWLLSLFAGAAAVTLLGIAMAAIMTVRLPAPTTEALTPVQALPLPGTVEPGPIAAGWYPGPAADKPRWWTGASWSDYLLTAGVPYPSRGQAERVARVMRRTAWVCFGLVAVAMALSVIAVITSHTAVVAAPVAIAVLAGGVGIGVRVGIRRAMRPFIRPMLPPTESARATP